MRTYARTGDDGTTGLFGGARVGKGSHRGETYGTVDAAIAVACSAALFRASPAAYA